MRVNAETKQSIAWCHICFPNQLRKACQNFSARTGIVTVFWDANEILFVRFMKRGKIVVEFTVIL